MVECRHATLAYARASAVLIALLLLVSPAAAAQSPGEIGGLNDAIVARVNGKALLLSQLRESALDLRVPVSALTSEGLRGDGFRKAITAQVDEELLVQAAVNEQISPDDTDIARRVDLMLKHLVARLGGDEALTKFLKQSHLSMDALRRMLVIRETRQDLATAIVGKRVKVSGEEIEEFRKVRREAGRNSEEAQLGQILIRCPKDEQGTALGRQLYEKALAAAREAGKSPAKFGEAALQYSDDAATRERGGMLGWVDPESLQEPLRVKVLGMATQQVSEPIASDTGYHVLYLVDRRSARDLLFAEKFEQERTKLVEMLREKAAIEIYPIQ